MKQKQDNTNKIIDIMILIMFIISKSLVLSAFCIFTDVPITIILNVLMLLILFLMTIRLLIYLKNQIMKITELIDTIISYLNDKINQESEILWMKDDGLLPFIRYDKDIVIVLWYCGAFVIINDIIHFISEDDGYWFLSNDACFHTDYISYYIEGLNKALSVYRNREKYKIGHWEKQN